MKKILAGVMVILVTALYGCGGSGGGSDTSGSSDTGGSSSSSNINSDAGTSDSSGSSSGVSTGDGAGTASSGSGTGTTTGDTGGTDVSGATGTTGGDSSGGQTPVLTAPSAPSEVTAQPGNAQVSVAWKGVSDATSYNLYWATTTGVTPSSVARKTGVTSPCLVSGLTNWTMHYFVVTAVNGYGESAVSNETGAIPMALFDASMLSGRTFNYSLTTGAVGVVTFNADGTFAGQNHTASSPFGGNWMVQNGVLVCLYTGGILETMMLKDNTATSFAFTYAVTFADGSNGTPVDGTFVQAE